VNAAASAIAALKIGDPVRLIKTGAIGVIDQIPTAGWNTVLFPGADPNIYSDGELELVSGITSSEQVVLVEPVIKHPHPAIAFIRDLYEPTDFLAFMLMRSGEVPIHWFATATEAATSEFVAKLAAKNDEGYNVYVGMNPLKTGSNRRTIENVAVIRNVWTEIDEDGRAKLDRIFASKDVPDPSIVLESSPDRFQFIWKTKDLTPAEASALVKSITAEFGGDPNACDLARVLRTPGFQNHKYAEKPLVEVVHESAALAKRYTKSDFTIPQQPVSPAHKNDQAERILIKHGEMYRHLIAQAGKLWREGYPPEEIPDMLVAWAHSNCQEPIDEAKVRQYAAGNDWKNGDGLQPQVTLGGQQPGLPREKQQPTTQTQAAEIPIIEDDGEDAFEMSGDTFDTKVYEKLGTIATDYPDPGEGDLVSRLAHNLVHGTNISLAHCREPLKAIVLHALDGHVIHPAYPDLALRGNYLSLGESDSGKTKGLQFALDAGKPVLALANIHTESLFVYKSEGAFIRGFSAQGTLKTDKKGITTGHPGHASQFLYVKEGQQIATCGDYFQSVFSLLMDLYDQTETGTSSLANGDFRAENVKASCVICFTSQAHESTFGGKGSIGGGGHNRWAMVNPPENHDYDAKDWERLPEAIISKAQVALLERVQSIFNRGVIVPIQLTEEPKAKEVRLQVKKMLKDVGRIGKRLMDYFVREQVCLAVTAINQPNVMTGSQAEYAKRWVEAQLECRTQNWPADAGNPVEAKEHAIRKAVNTHFVSERTLKDVCHFYREGSGGWWAYSTALRNVLSSKAIKRAGKTRKGVWVYCPGSCTIHPEIIPAKGQE
jgi:hypothetical protein